MLSPVRFADLTPTEQRAAQALRLDDLDFARNHLPPAVYEDRLRRDDPDLLALHYVRCRNFGLLPSELAAA